MSGHPFITHAIAREVVRAAIVAAERSRAAGEARRARAGPEPPSGVGARPAPRWRGRHRGALTGR